MEYIRKYLIELDKIKDILNNMPELGFDEEISNFYNKVYDIVEDHEKVIIKRLNKKEMEIMKNETKQRNKKKNKNKI